MYPQRIDWSVKMFDELLMKNPHVKEMCKHYQVDIDGCHGALVKDMIRGTQGPSDDSGDEEAGEESKTKRLLSDEKPFLLEVKILRESTYACLNCSIVSIISDIMFDQCSLYLHLFYTYRL